MNNFKTNKIPINIIVTTKQKKRNRYFFLKGKLVLISYYPAFDIFLSSLKFLQGPISSLELIIMFLVGRYLSSVSSMILSSDGARNRQRSLQLSNSVLFLLQNVRTRIYYLGHRFLSRNILSDLSDGYFFRCSANKQLTF